MRKSERIEKAWGEALVVADSLEVAEEMRRTGYEYVAWDEFLPEADYELEKILLKGAEIAAQEQRFAKTAFVMLDDGNGCWVFFGDSENAVVRDIREAAGALAERKGLDPSNGRYATAVRAMRDCAGPGNEHRVRTDPRGGTAYWEAESQVATVRLECHDEREEVFVNWASPGSMDPDKATRLSEDIRRAVDMARAARAAMSPAEDES